MAQKKNKRHRKVAFVFLEPLTKVPPALAGSGARKCGGPESVMKKQAPPQGGICFSWAINEGPACASRQWSA